MGRRPIVFACALLVCALPAPSAQAMKNPADRLAEQPIDDYRYDYAKRCLKRPQPGMVALQRWLEKHWAGSSWGIMRCERLSGSSYSLHSEGRALDWALNARDRSQKRAANRLVRLLLATDRAGNEHALARRMGVQELIWNCHAWFGYGKWRRYSLCFDSNGRPRRVDDTSAHRNHVHIGMSKRGARKRTSFWRR